MANPLGVIVENPEVASVSDGHAFCCAPITSAVLEPEREPPVPETKEFPFDPGFTVTVTGSDGVSDGTDISMYVVDVPLLVDVL
jgi:hypothetical protein